LDEWITDRLEKGSVSRMQAQIAKFFVLDPKTKYGSLPLMPS